MNEDEKEIFGNLENEKTFENSTKFKFSEENYLNVRLGAGEKTREIHIRILPAKNSKKIHTPIHIHSMKVDPKVSASGFKTFICLNDELLSKHDDKGCPLCNHAKELFDKANELPPEKVEERKALFKEGYKYRPKITYIVRVIERGKENEGVKFWRFNKYDNGNGIMDKLMNIYRQRRNEAKLSGIENYNIFDLHNGKDFILTLTKSENTNNRTEISIMDSGFSTPLSKDEAQIEKWVNDEKDWSDVYTSRPYSYLKVIADGGVPVFDRSANEYVSKEENEIIQQKIQEEALQEVRIEINASNNDDGDLPF